MSPYVKTAVSVIRVDLKKVWLKMNKRTSKILFLTILVFLAAAAGVAANESAQRRKARYYYAGGVQQQAIGNEAAAYEYFKKAYESDPTYTEGASAYGTRRLYIGLDTLQSDTELGRSLSLMRTYVDEYPDDLYESLYYGYVAGQLGSLDEAVRVLERTYSIHPETSNILLQLSEVYARANDLPKAIEAIDRYERQEGLSPQITTQKLSFLLAEKDTTAALSEVSRLLESNPADASYSILKGNVFDIISMPDSALVYYKRAEKLEPESGAPKLALASYYQQIGDSIAYDNKIYEVLLTEDLGVDQKTDLLAQYLQTLISDNRETARGDHLFSVLRNQYPHEPKVLDLAARYSAAKQNFADAQEQISYALDLDPANITYWGQLMTYQAAGDNPKEALATFERAKSHVVPDDQLKFYAASVAQMAEDYGYAADVYRNMICDIDAKLPVDSVISLSDVRTDISMENLDMLSRLFCSLGDVYNAAGKYEDSYRAYDNAITLDSSNAMAKNNYAYFLSENGGDLGKALALSSEAIQGADAENPTYLDTYAWILFLKGNVAEAEQYQRKAIEAMEKEKYGSSEIYDHFGDILARKGDMKEALEAWRKAAELQEKLKETDKPEHAATLEKIKNAEKALGD